MKLPSHDQRRRFELKMTPMIDVIFLLLIFFVCTASFQPPERVLPTQVSLPGAVETDLPPPEELEDLDELIVALQWDEGRPAWEINRRRYAALGEVRAVLEATQEIQPGLPVILKVAPRVPMEHVIDLYDLCRVVGLDRVQFAARVDG